LREQQRRHWITEAFGGVSRLIKAIIAPASPLDLFVVLTTNYFYLIPRILSSFVAGFSFSSYQKKKWERIDSG